MELEHVFLRFIERFEALPNPKSVAEARITSDEFEALTLWFSERWEPRMWCESTWQIAETSASRQEMFGALLLILASEVCRDKSNEDSVWPAVTAVLKANKVSYPALFVGGQPTTAFKKALAAGAYRLSLRNLIDRYGAQEYFDTLKLQFGFTFRGAARRLPDWLDGLGLPIAVKILSGIDDEYADLESSSFAKLWKTLQDFRRSRVSEEYTSSILKASAWIRPEWSAELLRVARLRIRPTSLSAIREDLDHSSESICEPILRWEFPSKPQLFLRLNEERVGEILREFCTATFAVDGRVVDRWIAQEDGGWRGRRELPCQPEGERPNLRPRLLSISSEGELAEEVDLIAAGIGEPLLIFDLQSGSPVDLGSKFDCTRDYALICDTDLTIPEVSQSLNARDRSVYRLVSPWHRDVCVVCNGIPYWQPRIDEKEPLPPIRLALESRPGEVTEIGSASHVRVKGVPGDATAVSLIIASSSHSVIQHDAVWQTERPVRITLSMALGEERVRIRTTGANYARTVTPKLSLNLRGIACVETDTNISEPQWTLLNRHRPLNRADGSGRARIFVGTSRSQLYEGPCLVGRITSLALSLRSLQGWGYPLIVCSDDPSPSKLVGSVEDRGCVGLYVPSLLGKARNELHFRTPVPRSADHQILVWSDMYEDPQRVPGEAISSDADGFVWKLPGLGSVAAMAVVYRGARIGSYWATEPVIRALQRAPSVKLFAIFRWLKLPVLNPSFRTPMQEAVARSPAEFVRGWIGDEALPYGLVHRQAEQGVDAVIRAFLWAHVEKNEAKMGRLARAFPRPLPDRGAQSDSEDFKALVLRLGEVCPALAYILARHKLRGDKYWKYVRTVAAALLRQPDNADLPELRFQLNLARRECARLVDLTPETLDSSVKAFGTHLDNQDSNYTQVEADLRRLGETSRGRQFLMASLLLRLLERVRF